MPYPMGKTPSAKHWCRVATEEAEAAGLDPVKLLAGEKSKGYPLARWKAFARLKNEDPDYSLSGMARVSSFDHASIRYGLRRLQGHGPDTAKGSADL